MQLFAGLYRLFQPRRGWLLVCLLLVTLVCVWSLSHLHLAENIEAMLPDGHSQVASDFRLLQKAPFARKVVIHLFADDGVTRPSLLDATGQLQKALPDDLFVNSIDGPGSLVDGSIRRELGAFLPRLLESEDFDEVSSRIHPDQIDKFVAEVLSQLLQPQGVAMKTLLQNDPLQLDEFALRKLKFVNPISNARIEGRQFISQDGRSSLIVADTPVEITDAAGAHALLKAFENARQTLPSGINAELVSGHRYTLANAATIKSDMQRLLLLSACGILIVFAVFLRSFRALSVYLLPLFSMLAAVMFTSFFWNPVSGITIGFGAVLLGITIDFGLHAYFALRQGRGTNERARLLQAVSRPVLFGGMTTMAAFAVLLRSDLPGQRQLAVFAISGILAALLFALLVLPHFTGEGKNDMAIQHRFRRHFFDRRPRIRLIVLLSWVLISGLALFQAHRVSINGELRQLSYVPAELQHAEQHLALQWGNMRGRALVFAEGRNLEAALQQNELVWQELRRTGNEESVVSLAPLFPSQRTQEQRLNRWNSFWQTHGAQSLSLLKTSSVKYGFSEDAFNPFRKRLEETPEEINQERLEQWGLGPLLKNLLIHNDEGYQLLTLIPDRPEVIEALEDKLVHYDGISLVSQSRFSRQLSREIEADFGRFISSAGIAVVILLLVLFRRLPDMFLATLPVLTGLLVMYGGMVTLGLEMNLFNVIASILIIGLGVDYGIFMVCHGQQQEDLASSAAVMVSGLTTIVGFGALVFAKHPALHSIGVTVLLGICAAVPTALVVIPAFQSKRS